MTDVVVTRSAGAARKPSPPSPWLFRLLEGERPQASSSAHRLVQIDHVMIGRSTAWEALRSGRQLVLRVPDSRMSSQHARLLRELDRWLIEDTQSKNGVLVNGRALRRTVLADGDLIELGSTFFLYRESELASGDGEDLEAAPAQPLLAECPTFSSHLIEQLALIPRLAASPISVLIRGETGTGKERVARALHRLSGRKGPWVAMNCGSIPEPLMAAELFGYARGAFTGADTSRVGLMQTAHLGTLFLDEVADLPLPAQAVLLRALQEREVLPLGTRSPVPVDIRILAATHRPLESLVEQERFREDLYARLAGSIVAIPPLRERREDLGVLFASLLAQLAPKRKVIFDPSAARALLLYAWPRNVRELESCLAAALTLARDDEIALEHLPASVRAHLEVGTVPELAALSREDRACREQLEALLREHRGNISAVARAMGKQRMQVHRWLKRFQLRLDDYR
jgi:transcriptional regulator with PAS, ATPase and Fis domain